MTATRWKLVFMALVIMGAVLFIRCTPGVQEDPPTITFPAQGDPEDSADISSTVLAETSVELVITEATSTKTPITSKTPTVVSHSESTSLATPEPTSTLSLSPTSTVDLTSQIYMFVSDTGFHYSWMDFFTNRREVIDISNYGIPSDSVGSATTLSFSHSSNQVAFWFRKPGEPGTLWLADIKLKEPKLIFTDNDEVFTSDESFPPKDVTIDWLPNDEYLVVQSIIPSDHNIFVDVSTNSYQEDWPWNCRTIITSPKTSQLALLCTNNSERSVIEWDGEIWTNGDITGENILWEWEDNYMLPLSPFGSIPPWSPDGRRIAYIPEEEPGTLQITENKSESLSITFEVDTLFPHTIRWIDNGKILVGGYKEDWPASWFIVDSNTGQLLWSLEETKGFDLSPQQQREQLLLKGEISKSGEYLALSTNRTDIPSGNQILLVDIKNNQYLGTIADIGHGLDAYLWGR